MYRRRRPVRNRARHAKDIQAFHRQTPRFSFFQIRDEIRATNDVVIALTRDRMREEQLRWRERHNVHHVGSLTLV